MFFGRTSRFKTCLIVGLLCMEPFGPDLVIERQALGSIKAYFGPTAWAHHVQGGLESLARGREFLSVLEDYFFGDRRGTTEVRKSGSLQTYEIDKDVSRPELAPPPVQSVRLEASPRPLRGPPGAALTSPLPFDQRPVVPSHLDSKQ